MVGLVSGHVAETLVLGLHQRVVFVQIDVGAGVDDHQMKLRVQLVEIVVVLKIFAVRVLVKKNIVEAGQLLFRDQRSVVSQNVGFINRADFKNHVYIVDGQRGNGDAALRFDLHQPLLLQAA